MKNLNVLLIVLCLAGCATQPPSRHVAEGPKVKPECMVFTPEQVAAPSRNVGQVTMNQTEVLIGSDVIAYPIAGRQDPNHPDVAYMGTWALRRTAPQWRLQPAPAKEVVFGPSRSEARQELKPVQKQEVETLLLEQRTLNDENRQAITRLIRIQKDQQRQIAEMHQAIVSKAKTDKSDQPVSESAPAEKNPVNTDGAKPTAPTATP